MFTILVKLGVAATVILFLAPYSGDKPEIMENEGIYITEVEEWSEPEIVEIKEPEEPATEPIKEPEQSTPTQVNEVAQADPEPEIKEEEKEPEPVKEEPAPQKIYIYVEQPKEPVAEADPIPEPEEQTITMQEYTMELIEPIKGKGFDVGDRLAREEIKDEKNYIELGVILRDGEGNPVRDKEVQIEATDSSQNKTINGTGTMTNIYINGIRRAVPYYHFSYVFKQEGDHKITFTGEDQTEEVIIKDVKIDERE